jgi:two-component system response regulator YesN
MFKLLIVDDELYIREGLKALIKWGELGFEICGLAENGQQALKLIEETKPDVIITDIKMPLINGLELIKEVKEKIRLDIKFIVLSGYCEFDYAKQAMRYGVKNYVLKPIEEEELEIIVKELYHELVNEKKDKEANLKAVNALSEISLKTILKSEADRESVDNVKKFLNVGYTEYFRYIMLEVENSFTEANEELDENDKCNILRDYLVEILGEEYKYNILKDDGPNCSTISYGIIVTENLLENYKNDMNFLIEFIYVQLTKKINKRIYMYVGKSVNELLALRESYDSSLFTHSFRFYKKNCNVIYYDDIKDVSISSDFNERLNFDDLVEAIENNNTVEIDGIINSYFNEEGSSLIDMKLLPIKINYFIYQVIKIVSIMNGDTTEVIKYSSNLNLNNFITFDEIKKGIKVFSNHCAKYINNLRQNQCCGILYDIEKYIHENCCSRITLKEVANQFYINSAYLGQIFKKRYGVSFNDYIHQYRMEKAKELLKRTDFKIYEISGKLGYKNTDNFIEKFEKINGITPLQYRKNKLEKNA